MVERFTKEGEDVFWPQFVPGPGGCRVASDLPDSAAGATIVVYQTWKDKREREKRVSNNYRRNSSNAKNFSCER